MPRFSIGDFMKRRKDLREKIVMANRGIKETSQELISVEDTLAKTKKKLDAKVHKRRRVDEKVN